MSGHWRFLELSLPTSDVAASLDFYRSLGFTEIPTNDVRGESYAVVSDGRIALGLHGSGLPSPGLSFVQSDTALWARQLKAAGFELEFERLGVDDFHEFALVSPAGHLAMVMEAPTFSRQQITQATVPVTGYSSYIRFGCPSLSDAMEFWRVAGLEEDAELQVTLDSPEETIEVEGAELAEQTLTTEVVKEERDEVELLAPTLRLRLRRGGSSAPVVRFNAVELGDIAEVAERFGLPLKQRAEFWEIVTPEGTRLELDIR